MEGIIRALSGIIGGGRLSVCLRAKERAIARWGSFRLLGNGPRRPPHTDTAQVRDGVSADNLSLLCLH